jgi:hypothetical protein
MQNAEAKQAMIDTAEAWEAGRKERDDVKAIAAPATTTTATPAANSGATLDASSAPKPKKKTAHFHKVCSMPISTLI